jgi:hypothetical protein
VRSIDSTGARADYLTAPMVKPAMNRSRKKL